MTVTDRQLALQGLKENVDMNTEQMDTTIRVQELDWAKDLKNYTEKYDLILGADIIYIEETFQDLLKTFQHLSSCNSQVLLSCKIAIQDLWVF